MGYQNTSDWKVSSLTRGDTQSIEDIAKFLVPCFREFSPAWVPTIAVARTKIWEFLEDGRVNRIVVNGDGEVLGCIAVLPNGHIWEIHPLAVRVEAQGQGIGSLLIGEIEKYAKRNGAVGIWAGTSDETGVTSLTHKSRDLLTDPIKAMAEFNAPANHPAKFYCKVGFTLVGLFPDEEGLNKPGITFYKRLI